MDHATGGRFILGLGAGWFEPEHTPFGIPFPPMPERFDRFESAVHVDPCPVSAEAATEPGVTRPDPFYPLDGATNDPPPLTPGGPPIWLGGQKRRGIALAAAAAPMAGSCRRVVADKDPHRHVLLRRETATRCWSALTADRARPGGLRDRRPRSRPARPPRPARRAWRGARSGRASARRTSSSGCRRDSGRTGVDAVARDDRRPLRDAPGWSLRGRAVRRASWPGD